MQLIEEQRPDLVFLDIQMPGMDGFGVLRALSHKPEVVFATAYDSYAIKAFEVHAADYLLKPISRDRLTEAVRRVRGRRDNGVPVPDVQELVRTPPAARAPLRRPAAGPQGPPDPHPAGRERLLVRGRVPPRVRAHGHASAT